MFLFPHIELSQSTVMCYKPNRVAKLFEKLVCETPSNMWADFKFMETYCVFGVQAPTMFESTFTN